MTTEDVAELIFNDYKWAFSDDPTVVREIKNDIANRIRQSQLYTLVQDNGENGVSIYEYSTRQDIINRVVSEKEDDSDYYYDILFNGSSNSIELENIFREIDTAVSLRKAAIKEEKRLAKIKKLEEDEKARERHKAQKEQQEKYKQEQLKETELKQLAYLENKYRKQ